MGLQQASVARLRHQYEFAESSRPSKSGHEGCFQPDYFECAYHGMVS